MEPVTLTDEQLYLAGFVGGKECLGQPYMAPYPLGNVAYARLLLQANPGSELVRGHADAILSAIGEAL